ncbi:MAG: caspase family protein [Polyangia bacterium]
MRRAGANVSIALLAAVFCTAASVSARADPVVRIAVVAGNNVGLARSDPLKYAQRDAARMAELLREIGGVREENLFLLRGGDPGDLRAAFDAAAARLAESERDAVFLFFYSGHADSGWLRMNGRGIPLEEIRRRLELMPAKLRVAIVDACQSGAITRAKGGKVVSPFLEERPVQVEGLVILTSASAAEPAQESDILRSSFFSHHLMSGLRGPADRSGDGAVSAQEAYDHAYRFTVRETEGTSGGAQHPTFLYALEGEGEVELTAVETGRARIELAEELDGTVLFLDGAGGIEAEVIKRAGDTIRVALPPGDHEVRWRASDSLWVARVDLTDGAVERLGTESFERRDLEATGLKGDVAAGGSNESEDRPVEEESGPRPLGDTPLGGGATWSEAEASGSIGEAEGSPPSAGSETLPPIEPDPAVGENEGSRSFARSEEALLWPPLALGISLVGPGVPQMIEKDYARGGLLFGLFAASAVGAGVSSRQLAPSEKETWRAARLGGSAALGMTAFHLYALSAIDAFYSVTRGGPGYPDLEELNLDLELTLCPSLTRDVADELRIALAGGIGIGLAVHPNLVLGLRDFSVFAGKRVGAAQIAPEIRGRWLISPRVGCSIAAGITAQLLFDTKRLEGEERSVGEGRFSWSLFPYGAATLHYYPARSWSLDFGVRAGVTVRTRRLWNDLAQAGTAFAAEYAGGLTWYH